MPTSRPPPPPVDPDEDEASTPDEELDTPPEEGEEGEPAPDDEGDDDLDDLDDGGDDPRDDEGSDTIETDDDLDPVDEDEERGGDDDEIDVGPLDEGMGIDDDDERDGDAERAVDQGEEGDDLDIDERDDLDDGGVEGTSDDPEDEVDEAALPELDADEEGDEGDDELADLLLGDARSTPLPWADARWSLIDGAGAALPVRALSIEGGRLAAAGERLLLVDEGALVARRASFGAGSTAVALTGALLLVAGPRAQLSLSTDGGERGSPLPGFAATSPPIDLAATPGRLFLRADGALLGLTAPHHPPAILRERDVLAITATGATLIVLRRSAEGPVLERLRGDDEGWQETLLRGPIRRRIERARRPLLLAAAAGGRALALADEASITFSRDGGKHLETLQIEGIRALCFAGDDDAAPLLLLSTGLGAAPGEAAVLQLLPGADPTRLAVVPGVGDARAAMVWDSTRAVVWVACEAGLLALGRPPPH